MKWPPLGYTYNELTGKATLFDNNGIAVAVLEDKDKAE